MIRTISYCQRNFCIEHIPTISRTHCLHAYLLKDIFQDLRILVILILGTLLRNLPLIALHDRDHKNEFSPNKTIEQQNNKTYT